MGEAKRRKQQDPNYGKYPKKGKGLIVSNPMVIHENGGIDIPSPFLDPHELRRNLLFWDKLVWPKNDGIMIDVGSAEVDFLANEGILERPLVHIERGGSPGECTARAFVETFNKFEEEQPGRWSISEGPDSLILGLSDANPTRGTLVNLYRAIPVPDKDIPLEEILRFKEKRKDELLELKIEIDGIYTRVNNARDSEFEFNRALEEIDMRCANALKVAKEAKLKFRLSDLRLNFSLSIGGIASAGNFAAAGAALGEGFGLQLVGALVGGAAPFVTLSKGVSLARIKHSNSPFRVVGELEKDIL